MSMSRIRFNYLHFSIPVKSVDFVLTESWRRSFFQQRIYRDQMRFRLVFDFDKEKS
jgi:hypothetical protein